MEVRFQINSVEVFHLPELSEVLVSGLEDGDDGAGRCVFPDCDVVRRLRELGPVIVLSLTKKSYFIIESPLVLWLSGRGLLSNHSLFENDWVHNQSKNRPNLV